MYICIHIYIYICIYVSPYTQRVCIYAYSTCNILYSIPDANLLLNWQVTLDKILCGSSAVSGVLKYMPSNATEVMTELHKTRHLLPISPEGP